MAFAPPDDDEPEDDEPDDVPPDDLPPDDEAPDDDEDEEDDADESDDDVDGLGVSDFLGASLPFVLGFSALTPPARESLR
ncbi:hypothetical protein Ato02nite_078250 [Paractinoplanes toevensis]|uniref:Uncharacterized protein n=1 Tax=Paractinoplanes toevensis TaxID=571911 RepID=A0A919W9G9_9ACTN|nr:hypothetical protein Ato02nite_078250 [Actinoplanes toevensis]